MPIDSKGGLRNLSSPSKPDLCQLTRENRVSFDCELLFEYAQFAKPRGVLKRHRVCVALARQGHLDFEPYRHPHASERKIAWPDEVTYPICAAPDSSQHFKRQSHRRFARAIPAEEEDRGEVAERKLKVLQASKIVDIQSLYHGPDLYHFSPPSAN